MNIDEIATKKDIAILLEKVDRLEREIKNIEASKPFYTGKEVKELLGISEGTLQSLRIKRELTASKIGGKYYYMREDINNMFVKNRIQ